MLSGSRSPYARFFMRLAVCAVTFGLLHTVSVSAGSSADIDKIVGDNGVGYFDRQTAARSLDAKLAPAFVAQLIEFLDAKTGHGALDRDELLALKDVVCSALDRQAQYPYELPVRLVEMFADREHNTAWRDYCIQHLNSGYDRAQPEQREAIRKTFWVASDEINSTIAGTALIALRDHRSDPAINSTAIAAKALDIASNDFASDAARITAIQICAELDERKVLPYARKLVQTAKERPLRMSAIATLGALGELADREILVQYAASSDLLIQRAAKSALTRFDKMEKSKNTN